MRLPEVERGDRRAARILFPLLSRLTGARLPDAARCAMYHRAFVGPALAAWTHEAMRGPSAWTVAERELMAAVVARWGACDFCVGAHRAVAVRGMAPAIVDAVLADHETAPIAAPLRATLTFLERMTRTPTALTPNDAAAALRAGATRAQLVDAAAVATVFAIVTRQADALDFAIPSQRDLDRSAGILLRRGYR